MDDDQQILLYLMSFNILIVTVECAFGLGREIEAGYASLLLIPLILSFIGFIDGVFAFGGMMDVGNAKKINLATVGLSALALVLISFSPYVYRLM